MATIKKFTDPNADIINSNPQTGGALGFIKKMGDSVNFEISVPTSVKEKSNSVIRTITEETKEGVEWVADKTTTVLDAVPSPDDIGDWLDQWKIPLLIAGAGVLLLVAAPNIKALRSN